MATLAFLGLGLMGTPIATRLLEAGHDLTVWNRTSEKTKPLVDRGALAAASPAGVDAAITMVANPRPSSTPAHGSGWSSSVSSPTPPRNPTLPDSCGDFTAHLVTERRADTIAVFEMILAAGHDPELGPVKGLLERRLNSWRPLSAQKRPRSPLPLDAGTRTHRSRARPGA